MQLNLPQKQMRPLRTKHQLPYRNQIHRTAGHQKQAKKQRYRRRQEKNRARRRRRRRRRPRLMVRRRQHRHLLQHPRKRRKRSQLRRVQRRLLRLMAAMPQLQLMGPRELRLRKSLWGRGARSKDLMLKAPFVFMARATNLQTKCASGSSLTSPSESTTVLSKSMNTFRAQQSTVCLSSNPK